MDQNTITESVRKHPVKKHAGSVFKSKVPDYCTKYPSFV